MSDSDPGTPANAAADTLNNHEARNARRAAPSTDSDRPMRRVLPRRTF